NRFPESDLIGLILIVAGGWSLQYEMGPEFNYEPTQTETIAARAAAAGVSPEEYAYDLLMQDDGKGFIYFPILNYQDGNLNLLESMQEADDTVHSLSDEGARCGTICVAPSPTFMLQHGVRVRKANLISLELSVHRQCRDTARLYGLIERGVIAP